MTAIQAASAALALVVAAWPQMRNISAIAAGFIPRISPSGPPKPAVPSYKQAIDSLADVRLRLRETDCFRDDQKSAIDVLTLALVDGSDK